MKKLLLFVFFLIILIFPLSAQADSTFTTSVDITYTVSDTGITHAVFHGLLQNNTDKYYASSYSIGIGFADVENLKAFDSQGNITPVIEKDSGSTKITIPFNTHAVGLGSTENFTFSFDTTDVAHHTGSIWEVEIPGIANQADFKEFTTHLRVPSDFGDPAYIKPSVSANSLDFDKNTLGTSGISLGFGKIQYYSFSLVYHLQNTQDYPVKTEIALPLTTNYQDVSLSSLSKKPENVVADSDGNWLAQYILSPKEKLEVIAKGVVALSLSPKKEVLSQSDKKLFLQKQPYWETNDPKIIQLAKDLKTPRNIFDYVVSHLTYDYTRVAGTQSRLGASRVLQDPTSAVCLEFTDLFIALARAAGIPAREVDGFAYTQNTKDRPLSLQKDILHAWPQYYDETKEEWIMVDPTWENTTKGIDYFTTMDFDHIAFVVKGVDSLYPVPAGGYKYSSQDNTQEVSVNFTPANTQAEQSKLTLDLAHTIYSLLPITGVITIKNTGSVLIPKQDLWLSTTYLSPQKQLLSASAIPPFGSITIPFQFEKTSFLTNREDTITISFAGKNTVQPVLLRPLFFQSTFLIGGVGIAVLSIILLISAARTRRVPLFK